MERSRGPYRPQQHFRESMNRHHYEQRANHRARQYHDDSRDSHPHQPSVRNSPITSNYRLSRSSLNGRPQSSRYARSERYVDQQTDHYPPEQLRSSSLNFVAPHHDNHSSSARYHYSSYAEDLRRPADSEYHRYSPSSIPSTRRESSPPLTYRYDRSIDYGSRNSSNAFYSLRDDSHRTEEYHNRPERYEIDAHRAEPFPRDYSTMSASSSYSLRDPYLPSRRDISHRHHHHHPISDSSDSRFSYSPASQSSMDYQINGSRNSYERQPRPTLKRSRSRNFDDETISSKRPIRR